MVISSGSKFTPSAWNSTSKFLRVIFSATKPESLLTWKPSNKEEQNHVEHRVEETNRRHSSHNHVDHGSPHKTVCLIKRQYENLLRLIVNVILTGRREIVL